MTRSTRNAFLFFFLAFLVGCLAQPLAPVALHKPLGCNPSFLLTNSRYFHPQQRVARSRPRSSILLAVVATDAGSLCPLHEHGQGVFSDGRRARTNKSSHPQSERTTTRSCQHAYNSQQTEFRRAARRNCEERCSQEQCPECSQRCVLTKREIATIGFGVHGCMLSCGVPKVLLLVLPRSVMAAAASCFASHMFTNVLYQNCRLSTRMALAKRTRRTPKTRSKHRPQRRSAMNFRLVAPPSARLSRAPLQRHRSRKRKSISLTLT